MFEIGLTKTTLSNVKKEGVEVLSLETYQVVISLHGVTKVEFCGDPPRGCEDQL